MGQSIDIDTVVAAYVECALWSSSEEVTEESAPYFPDAEIGTYAQFDDVFDADDIDAEGMASIRKDCAAFLADEFALIEESGLSDEQIGHDFWLTRNRHGAGFWDRGLGAVGHKLSDAAHVYGESNLMPYTADDGTVKLQVC